MKNGKVIANRPHAMVQDLDILNYPDRESIDLLNYRDYYLLGFKRPCVSMMTSRGCPYRCTFCDTHNVWKKEVRQRTPDNCLDEIDMLVKKYAVRYIDMVDDVFGIRHQWIEEFCRKLAERKYNLHYKILVNPSTFATHQEKCFEWLAKSGCDQVGIGMQTADQDTLNAIKRGTDDFRKLKKMIEFTSKNGMLSFVSFIAGFPNEPENAPEQIMDLVDEVRPTVIDCYPLIYLKGTDLEKKYSRGEITDTYPYPVRVKRALKVKKHFYTQVRNVYNIFKWLIINNPAYFKFALLSHPYYVASVAGFVKRP